MILTAYEAERETHAGIFEQMYRLRARQFGERRGWRVDVRDGLERDRFDDLNPLYVCVLSESRKLMASLRLLPTTGPHMLSDVFSEVMGTAGVIRHPLILESSRFCVDTEASREVGPEGINLVTRELLFGLFSTAQMAGIENIISVYDVFVERILRRAGCRFERLGPVVKYDDLRTVGGLFEVSDHVIDDVSSARPRAAA
ncbi:acyl-homoserine-lactone synthase [uncultured Roseobacter sp.]|uniref:acyl-homoserine-lactone synthase n=1 Tax=uncultured Roseobacter sp. TaxID=114847 RepID=UPI0026160413|nr:acyl-homoserine-lactone synthase [uncultured Roseobacter sp.]